MARGRAPLRASRWWLPALVALVLAGLAAMPVTLGVDGGAPGGGRVAAPTSAQGAPVTAGDHGPAAPGGPWGERPDVRDSDSEVPGPAGTSDGWEQRLDHPDPDPGQLGFQRIPRPTVGEPHPLTHAASDAPVPHWTVPLSRHWWLQHPTPPGSEADGLALDPSRAPPMTAGV
ncbi:hypothetical protein [Streptomyces sp. NPDC005438]|uniref:hypothetical protein n=1 Tax=Streptomyces sp. NPDC005438 TaxID=3156880 RepID=UPI0033B71FD8